MADISGASGLSEAVGSKPQVDDSLTATNRVISSVSQAFEVCQGMVNDWKNGIKKAAKITSKINGERPYNQGKLKQGGKDHKTNISTGFLATECSKVIPRFFMPVKTAKYLTAAELPSDWPNAAEKTAHFRSTITKTVRSWPKFNFYIRGLAREVGIYGFAFNAWFDEYDWRPSLIRMDKGFVPFGTEIMEEPAFFMAKWDYKPHELLDLVRRNVDAGRKEWNKDNVVKAINAACAQANDTRDQDARTYEEMIRQSAVAFTYSKGVRSIRTYHLFAKETSGAVSHYVLLADQVAANAVASGNDVDNSKLLFEYLDQYQSMSDAVNAMVFDYGDGTIHGSLGAGHILYDLSVQVEKVRCDSIDNIRLTNKVKAHVTDAKNINDVKCVINDTFVIVSGAEFAGNVAGMTADVQGYEALDMKLTQIAQQKIGAFVPPIPLQPSDIKAAQINAAMQKEQELQEALLENWLIQVAELMRTVTRRLCDPTSPDAVAQKTQETLRSKLTDEEIAMLVNDYPVKSVMDFTEFRAQQRAMFAATVVNNPLFRQAMVARVMAEGSGDESFVRQMIVPEGDQSDVNRAARQQKMENAAMAIGQPVEVVPDDNDWVHMQTLKPQLQQMLMADGVNPQLARIGLDHYRTHWEQGVNKKVIPDDQINVEKQWIAAAEKTIAAHEQYQLDAQQRQSLAKVPEQEPAGDMMQGRGGMMNGGGDMM